jgi:hypothetical protein
MAALAASLPKQRRSRRSEGGWGWLGRDHPPLTLWVPACAGMTGGFKWGIELIAIYSPTHDDTDFLFCNNDKHQRESNHITH